MAKIFIMDAADEARVDISAEVKYLHGMKIIQYTLKYWQELNLVICSEYRQKTYWWILFCRFGRLAVRQPG